MTDDEERYEFTIKPDGTVEIAVKGVIGEGCLESTHRVVKSLNGQLGGVTTSKTEEFHATTQNRARGRAR